MPQETSRQRNGQPSGDGVGQHIQAKKYCVLTTERRRAIREAICYVGPRI